MLRFKHRFLLALALSGGALSGCAAPQGNGTGRGIAASFVAGRAFNRAKAAIRRDNSAGLERAGREMSRAAAAGSNPRLVGVLVTELAGEANTLSLESAQASGDEKIRLEESSNARYRSALAFAPTQAPEKMLDAPQLNALGYFLADKGSTRDDFERAAVLTKAAYHKWDLSENSPDGGELGRATGPQDSYAWALFKLGQYPLARAQEEKVWDLARGAGSEGITADIPFHLAEIYRALNMDKKARQTYQAALALSTSKPLSQTIVSRLKALDLSQV